MVRNAKTELEKKLAATALKEGPYKTHPHPVTYYSSVEQGLFESVINNYMSNYHGADHSAPVVAGEAPASETHVAVEHTTASQGE